MTLHHRTPAWILRGGLYFSAWIGIYSFEEESGGLKVGPFETLHTVSWNRLVAAAEKCRIDLSTSTKASVYLPDLIDGVNLGPMEITRREFEEAAVAPLVERIEEGIVSTLTNAAQFDKDRETPLEVRVNGIFFISCV